MVCMAFYRALRASWTAGIFCGLILSLEFVMAISQSTVAPPAPSPAPQQQPQVVNMLEALRDAGQFGAIAGLLDGLQMKNLTPMTTWLVPNDEAFSGASYPSNVTRFIDYHVIRELLPYSRLATLSVGTKLPTFLGREVVVVTNNLASNYSLDNAMVVVPDLYTDSTVAVHGINAVLNDALFNEGVAVPPPGKAPTGAPSTSPPSGVPSSSSPSSSSPPADNSNPIDLPNAAPFRSIPMVSSLALVLVVFTWTL